MSSDDLESNSRRRLVQGATLGLASAVAVRAAAQTGATSTNGGTAQAAPLQDPRSLYPHPPFPTRNNHGRDLPAA